jgi:superfamily II DNA or RNA helicase
MPKSKPSTAESLSPTSGPAISSLKFPFRFTKDQFEAVDSWITNGYKGSIIYSTGSGKTEIAFECARRACESIEYKQRTNVSGDNLFSILFLLPRIVLVQQNIDRLTKYGIPQEKIGPFFGERKEVCEITISTYQSAISNLDLINNANMIIFDEVHLVSDTATTLRKVFDFVTAGDHKKPLPDLSRSIPVIIKLKQSSFHGLF